MVSADIKKDPKMTVWFFFNLCGYFACLCVWVTLACFVSWEKGSRHSGATVGQQTLWGDCYRYLCILSTEFSPCPQYTFLLHEE